MENKLMSLTNDRELRVTSVELVDIINEFRRLESESTGRKYFELRHDNLKMKIEKEISILESVGINALNFKVVEYIDKKVKPDLAIHLIEMECFKY